MPVLCQCSLVASTLADTAAHRTARGSGVLPRADAECHAGGASDYSRQRGGNAVWLSLRCCLMVAVPTTPHVSGEETPYWPAGLLPKHPSVLAASRASAGRQHWWPCVHTASGRRRRRAGARCGCCSSRRMPPTRWGRLPPIAWRWRQGSCCALARAPRWHAWPAQWGARWHIAPRVAGAMLPVPMPNATPLLPAITQGKQR